MPDQLLNASTLLEYIDTNDEVWTKYEEQFDTIIELYLSDTIDKSETTKLLSELPHGYLNSKLKYLESDIEACKQGIDRKSGKTKFAIIGGILMWLKKRFSSALKKIHQPEGKQHKNKRLNYQQATEKEEKVGTKSTASKTDTSNAIFITDTSGDDEYLKYAKLALVVRKSADACKEKEQLIPTDGTVAMTEVVKLKGTLRMLQKLLENIMTELTSYHEAFYSFAKMRFQFYQIFFVNIQNFSMTGATYDSLDEKSLLLSQKYVESIMNEKSLRLSQKYVESIMNEKRYVSEDTKFVYGRRLQLEMTFSGSAYNGPRTNPENILCFMMCFKYDEYKSGQRKAIFRLSQISKSDTNITLKTDSKGTERAIIYERISHDESVDLFVNSIEMELQKIISLYGNDVTSNDHVLQFIYILRGRLKTVLHSRYWLVTSDMFTNAIRETALIAHLYYTVIFPTDCRMPICIPSFDGGFFHEKDMIDDRTSRLYLSMSADDTTNRSLPNNHYDYPIHLNR